MPRRLTAGLDRDVYIRTVQNAGPTRDPDVSGPRRSRAYRGRRESGMTLRVVPKWASNRRRESAAAYAAQSRQGVELPRFHGHRSSRLLDEA